jgi:hypothetical protein
LLQRFANLASKPVIRLKATIERALREHNHDCVTAANPVCNLLIEVPRGKAIDIEEDLEAVLLKPALKKPCCHGAVISAIRNQDGKRWH